MSRRFPANMSPVEIRDAVYLYLYRAKMDDQNPNYELCVNLATREIFPSFKIAGDTNRQLTHAHVQDSFTHTPFFSFFKKQWNSYATEPAAALSIYNASSFPL
jgi:hypothetical protein